MFSVLGTLGLFVAVGLLRLFRTFGEFGVRGPFGVFHAFGLLSAVDVFRPFGVFGSIGAFGAIGLHGVPHAFGRFAAYSARSTCLVRLVRLARLARSVRWAYFGRSLYSVCPVCVDACGGVAVNSAVDVDVAVGIHVGAAAIFASYVNIGMRVDGFVCFGRLRLYFFWIARSRAREFAHVHAFHKKKQKGVIAKRSPRRPRVGNIDLSRIL